MIDNYTSDMKTGLIGEEIIKKHYLSKHCNVQDKRNSKYYKNIDVDFVIDGQKIEVKTQNSIPNKHELTIELYYDLDSQPLKKGWFFRSQADYLIFYDQVNRKAYKIKSYHLKQYIDFHSRTKDLEFRKQPQYTKGYGTRTAELCFIPIEKFKKEHPVQIITVSDLSEI